MPSTMTQQQYWVVVAKEYKLDAIPLLGSHLIHWDSLYLAQADQLRKGANYRVVKVTLTWYLETQPDGESVPPRPHF